MRRFGWAARAVPRTGAGVWPGRTGLSLWSHRGDTPLAFAAIVLLSVLSVLLFYLVAGLERLLLPWAREITG
jgi:hypothetical protein